MSRILVVGSSNTDMIVRLSRLPAPGETVIGGVFSTAGGGKGANQAVAAARAGGSVTFVGRVGADDLGDAALGGLRRDRIRVGGVVRDRRAPSGVAFICVARGGENCIAVASGANGRLSAADVGRAETLFKRADILLVQLETPLAAVEEAVRIAARRGVPVILNPAPARRLPGSLLKRLAVITPNEHEAGLLTGVPVTDEESAGAAADILLRRGVRTVLVTLGRRGVYAATRDTRLAVKGFAVKAVDTTAAGDVFNGALAVALAEGAELLAAIRFAQAAAAISVTRAGAQPSAPRRAEIERFLAGR